MGYAAATVSNATPEPFVMPAVMDAAAFLQRRDQGVPLLDVRSPSEYARGHIPGAMNLPLFDDGERARVGAVYARQGRASAVATALALVGGQLEDKLARARALTGGAPPEGTEVLLHCWRGGMRSGALGWLLKAAGFRVHLLSGGYKAYRRHARLGLEQPRRVVVIGGLTGSGKTEILHALARLGEQTVDLEGLAGHRGSAFGALGDQPSNEWFENQLFERWRSFDPQRTVWLEDESIHIGSVTLYAGFFSHIPAAPLVCVGIPEEDRLKRLLRLYAGGGAEDRIRAALQRLRKRLGYELTQRCLEQLEAGDYRAIARAVLSYYDRCYRHQLSRRDGPVLPLIRREDDPEATARRLMELRIFP